MEIIFVNKHGVIVQEEPKMFLWMVPPIGSLVALEHYGLVKVSQLALGFPKESKLPTYPEALIIEVRTNTEQLSYNR